VFWVSFGRKQCSFRYRSLLHQNQSAGLRSKTRWMTRLSTATTTRRKS
jgi:hypothetical protein